MLRRSNIRVTKQFLYRTQIRAASQQMRCEAMPERVRADFGIQASAANILFDQNPQHLARQPFASLADEHPWIILVRLRESRAQVLQVNLEHRNRRRPERYDSLLAAFSRALAETRVQVQIGELQIDHFRR